MDDDPLVAWSLATFHTALLVALLVTGLYLAGPLGELLSGLRTSVGLVLYLVLWATTWWTNRRWLRTVGDPETDASVSVVVGTGGKWGGVDGVVFFWVLLAGFAVVNLPVEVGRVLGALPFFFVVGAIGSVLALGVGGIVGVLFAVLDLALFRAAERLAPDAEA